MNNKIEGYRRLANVISWALGVFSFLILFVGLSNSIDWRWDKVIHHPDTYLVIPLIIGVPLGMYLLPKLVYKAYVYVIGGFHQS